MCNPKRKQKQLICILYTSRLIYRIMWKQVNHVYLTNANHHHHQEEAEEEVLAIDKWENG